jgi:malate dehydrogenase (oxaloacetate-decarboxylating)
VFSWVFGEALDCIATQINEEMKMAAAHAMAECITYEYLQRDYIIPRFFDVDVVKKVANAVGKAARNSGIVRNRGRKKFD